MAFKKGQSGNPSGRPIGAQSEKTKQWEELGDWIRSRGAQRAMEILAKCDDNEFMAKFENLLEYFKPKLSRQDTNITVTDIPSIELHIGKKDKGS